MISHASWSGAGVSWVQGTAAKTSALGEGYRETSKVRIPTEADWILKVMVAMAAADGRLDAREVGLIQKVYKDWTRPFRGRERRGAGGAGVRHQARRSGRALFGCRKHEPRRPRKRSSAPHILRCSPISASPRKSGKNSKMSPSRCKFPRINSTRSYEQLNLR